MPTTTALEIARRQIEFARQYTLTLLADIEDHEWFLAPAGTVTHIAWQVGHLAMAEYGLCLYRIRGRQTVDAELMSSAFRKKFSKGSQPEMDPAENPPLAEIRSVFERVHHQAMHELDELHEADLNDPIDPPHAVFDTKLGALYFCASHEMLHAGQIGLLRRLLGKAPIR